MKFTDAQKMEIGETVCSMWGANMQTGTNEKGLPYLYTQLGPNFSIRHFVFQLDGQVDEEVNPRG